MRMQASEDRHVVNTNATYEIERLPIIISFEETAAFTETYGFAGTSGRVWLEGQRIVPKGKASGTVFIFMHPATTLNLMPLPAGLARAGLHVMCCGSRYAKNDTALIMEKVAADLGAYVRHAREELGYKKVILVGWSGGGSLAMFYQSQAEKPTITHTPAGDPYNLVAANLIPADAVTYTAAHTGRARLLAEWIDPSVIDENDPDRRDFSLDLYHPDCMEKPPYSDAFLKRFREAQRARIRRITTSARNMLDSLKARGGNEIERPFIVHRTMVDPRFLDPTLEPNGRKAGWCYLGNPETANSGPAGIGRFSTLRAWLSQWSYEDSLADAVACAPLISRPMLIMENGADDAVPTSHVRDVLDVVKDRNPRYALIENANHYYRDQPALMEEAVDVMTTWLAENNLLV